MHAQNQSNTSPMIEASGVEKSFQKVRVLDGIALNVAKGSVFALLGPNGAGKTTLVRILTTLLKADSGEIRIAGHDLRREPEAVRREIALTGQAAAVDELLTGEENLRMMGKLFHLSSADTQQRAAELLEQFELVEAARRLVKTYSGGMRRRLDLAISLMIVPSVLFLDEPTTGLDPRSRLVMWDIIRDLSQSGVTIFLTTQYLEEADQLADKIAVLDNGQIIAEGTADTLKQRVGQDQLELVLASAQDMPAAQRVFGSQVLHYDAQKRSLRMAVENGPKQIKQILDQLELSEIAVENLSLRKPTLDDAFFILTGRETDSDLKDGGSND